MSSLLTAACCLTLGCGRVGVELFPIEVGSSDDDGAEPGDHLDGSGAPDDAGTEELDADGAQDDAGGAGLDAEADAGSDGATDAESDTGSDACSALDGSCVACDPATYLPDASCGVGHCRSTNSPSSCMGGVERACTPGTPRSSDDTTADGVDDDCDGQTDEDACTPRTDTYRAGSYSFAPPAGCTTVRVRIWGGGGASGDAEAGYWLNVAGGNGGAGGYAESTFTAVTSTMTLNVGGGGGSCTAGGAGGIPAHDGGAGGIARAEAGAAGSAPAGQVGGSGGDSSSGGDGGSGAYGGGGGGAGTDPVFAPHGDGGGGGAASVMVVNGASVVAGGGGGGGGAGSNIATAGFAGGHGGAGCGGNGATPTDEGGGGGGGGVCQGAITQAGTGRIPYDPGGSVLPADVARGGSNANDCQAGNEGYAIVSYSR